MRHLILKIKESGMPYKCSRSCLETVMLMLRGLRKKENSSSICIGCSFFVTVQGLAGLEKTDGVD